MNWQLVGLSGAWERIGANLRKVRKGCIPGPLKWIQNVKVFLSYVNTHSKVLSMKEALDNRVDKVTYFVDVSLLLSRQCLMGA